VFDTLILCRFYRDLYQWEQLATILKAVTGLELERDSMRSIAASVKDDTRRFNIREGWTRLDDNLPPRFHQEALPEEGKGITEAQMATMLAEYYRVRGWNEAGEPPP